MPGTGVRRPLGAESFALALACAWLLIAPVAARAQAGAAGFVKVLTGTATVVRAGQTLPIEPGDPVQQTDVLRTGADGHLGITLRDETRISLGPNTELAIAAYAFAPGAGELALVLRIVNGVMAYISGRIAALAPDAVRIETPSSIIGVRGTHVLVSAGQPPAAPVRTGGAPGARAEPR